MFQELGFHHEIAEAFDKLIDAAERLEDARKVVSEDDLIKLCSALIAENKSLKGKIHQLELQAIYSRQYYAIWH